MDKFYEYICDCCKSDNFQEIVCLRKYTNNQPIHICKNCGLVSVIKRRKPEVIAKDWSDRLFSPGNYTARIPAVLARQNFVAEMVDSEFKLKNKSLCDIGAGEGQFLEIVKKNYEGNVFGIEPSRVLCDSMNKNKIKNFCGTIEQYENSKNRYKNFNFLTMMWTLECCADPNKMLKVARKIITDEGFVVIATGSRILVPFKKPLHFYVNSEPLDTHPLRFSFNTLSLILQRNGFKVVRYNRYIDQDWLCVIAQKTKIEKVKNYKDNFKDVINFFERWDNDTKKFFSKFKG